MKRYINDVKSFDIYVDIEYPLAYLDFDEICSSIDLDMYDIPSGVVISRLKDNSSQALEDYDAFVENIEDLLIDVYGLELTYFNDSDDNSRYYNFLAKDSSGNIKFRFRLRLRISNHSSHRTKEQIHNKKEELDSPELKRLLTEDQIRKLQPYFKSIIVNDERYSSYEEAYLDINDKIENWVRIMTR